MMGWKKFVSWGMCQVTSHRPAVQASAVSVALV